MKACELDERMLPPRRVLEDYAKAGQIYEETVHDRAWKHFYALVNGNDKTKSQELDQKISSLYRIRDSKGEWLTYGLTLIGKNWKGNRCDFFHSEGLIENLPVWNWEIDPVTDKIMPNSTQVFELKKAYTIPFTKTKINELAPYFTDNCQFVVKAKDGRRYSCSQREFCELGYQELIDLKTGFTEYMNSKQQSHQQRK